MFLFSSLPSFHPSVPCSCFLPFHPSYFLPSSLPSHCPATLARSACITFRLSDSVTHRRRGVGSRVVRQESSLCTQYPFVWQSRPRYFRDAWTHWLVEATVQDCLAPERLVSTSMGRTDSTSTLWAYSMSRDCERKSLQALVALQTARQGTGYSPATDEMVMTALLWSRASIPGNSRWVSRVIGSTLTRISSFSLFQDNSWKCPMLDTPTLLTSMDTSSPSSCLPITAKKSSRLLSKKSATMHLVWMLPSSSSWRRAAKADSILVLLRAMMQMLKPRRASSWQKPSPMPSDPPVTTAHEPRPYRWEKFLGGRMALMRLQRILAAQRMKTAPPMTARKYTKLRAD